MAFTHKNQKTFYTDYAIKHGMIPTEDTINLFQVRLKKETTDIYNKFQMVNGKSPLEWNQSENYEVNEIVRYNEVDYKCVQECINKVPSEEPSFWAVTKYQEYTKFPASNYLAKDNQDPYDPSSIQDYEASNTYHPTTVKHVEDRLKYWFDNETVANADRLDGEHKDYFCTKQEFDDFARIALTEKSVVDSLESDNRRLPLSAYQGKVLKQLIDHINAILTSNDINLDELQEIVNWIKTNRDMIEALGIDSIKGLRDYLNRIDSDLNKRVTYDYWNAEFLNKIKAVDGHLSGVDADTLDGQHADYFLPASRFAPEEIALLLQKVPGSLGKIDADKLDGLDSKDFLRRSTSDTPTQDNKFSLGSTALRWSNIYAVNFQGTALRAKYADLAEHYEVPESIKSNIKAGHILGINKNGINLFNPGMKLFGVVSSNPGVILNNECDGVPIALKGRTPVYCKNEPSIGDYIYADSNGFGIVSETELDLPLVGICIGSIINQNDFWICEIKI
ncbi:hypothetical protein ACUPZ6_001791 [Campylobacter coli]